MKTSLLYLIAIVCWPSLVVSQKSHSIAKPNQVAVNTDPKDHVREISRRMTAAWENSQPKEVIKIVDKEIPGCSTQPDSVFCKAAIWYTGGYLFQNGFEWGDSMSENYKSIAVSYYTRILEMLPDNQDVLSNLLRLYEHGDSTLQLIQVLDQLANEYPKHRISYLVQIGDLYLRQADPTSASKYYQQAYAEDPWSEATCSRIVNIYKQYTIAPYNLGGESSSNAVNEFIYSCQDVGLANFSEEMARQQILKELNDPSLTSAKLIGDVLIWGDILAENNWFDTNRIQDFRKDIIIDSVLQKNLAVNADAILVMYLKIAKAQFPDQTEMDESWLSDQVYVRMDGRDPITPRSLCIKILKVKGEKAYFEGNLNSAEQFWQVGFQYAGNENILFTALGKELAQLYAGTPQLDPERSKMSDLVKELFEGKTSSYHSGNYEMIREYHIVLGSIFYDQKRFSSDGIDNAEFQLSRALSPAFGPIINPELRRMLAYVYEFNGNKEGMMTENIRAIMDMLRLDRVDEAKQVITDVAQYTADLPETYTTQLGALDRIQRLRSTCADPEGISFEDQSAVHQFLIDRQKQQDQQSTILDPEFVNEQYFKALSDQGQNIPETHPEWKQLMYSQALLRIANQDQLGSYEDYARLQRIRQSLASTLDRPELLSTTRFNKEANLKYKGTGAGEEYKSFVIPSLGQEIQIPQSMFRLNETVDEYYQPTVDNPPTTTMMPKIQYEEKTYKVIKYTDTPKEEAHQPVQQIIPQQQMQKNIVVEKEMMKVRPKG